ncbi:type VI secretion system-associated FHA domain protein TagH [Pluralibacter gergoviae]|uniref:Type VI secretion system-associated FHA domain protein TagH n=1 Tax=Pluralibacter gergoviae TaxID=61647 RepID=A0AAW8HVD7_PLUGE|nr:type VI secretion system-associated FHA domain protein TagH [Pluralibacter gergoviae]AVR02339.1 type VI secretion system-associated FHA domain protein TagH [Pluralibacter gergoviae]KMK03286.1 hypothetical protein ABW08_15215 [Pluralibacter gergoviae]KMK26316.1 hypothetical protein ABW11_14950 [Pluralibacter gergoviae]MDQ2311068.1 type VI secretion system-associated FHA domain protein TagH [Pluralibacter gergoviae]HDS1114211.1 type VI secretion system-associated FHA domain protein TagH [Plur
MRFTIISSKAGQQPPQSSCDFYPPGGTIGRGTDNNLVLPDADRAISRLQAIVHVDASGECRITNRGNVTKVVLNDIPLEHGRQVELQDGDILTIDEYRIEVSDLVLDTQPVSRMAAAAQPVARPQPAAPAAPAPPAAAPTAEASDATPTAVPSEIWDSLMQEFSISDSISTGRAAKPQPAAEEHDPFEAPQPAERNPEDPLAMFNDSEPLFAQKGVDTDRLFAEETPFNKESIFADVTPTALVQPDGAPAKPAPAAEASQDELDPLALFGGGEGAKAARSDDPLGLMGGAPLTPVDAYEEPAPQAPARQAATEPVRQPEPDPARQEEPDPELTSPLFMEPPQAVEPSPQPEPAPPKSAEPTQSAPQQPQTPPESDDLSGITLPTPQTVVRQAAQTPKGRLRIDPVQNSGSAADPQQPASGDVLQGELLEALLEGMGLGDMQPVPQFDRENMRQLGQMMSMFSQGTVALLSSRSILKRGVKADMTMVLDDANNPFKLLPSGKTVLMQMFGARMPGFMPPKKSVRDALIDLQAHQLGMISGIRAIIAAMLQSFNPEQLEEEAKRDGVTSRLSLSATRKAALWDYFVRTYGETAGEIEDDFHTLFGEAFLYAYDMEVNQYKDSQSGSEE